MAGGCSQADKEKKGNEKRHLLSHVGKMYAEVLKQRTRAKFSSAMLSLAFEKAEGAQTPSLNSGKAMKRQWNTTEHCTWGLLTKKRHLTEWTGTNYGRFWTSMASVDSSWITSELSTSTVRL